MVILILTLIWAAALLPPFIRSRMEGSPAESVGRFRRHLRVLQSTSPAASSLASAPDAPRGAMPARWANEARRLKAMRRRRQVVSVLLGAMALTLVAGLIPALRPLLVLHVMLDAAFVSYLVMLARLRAIESERVMMAHFEKLRAEAALEAQAMAEERRVADAL